MTLALAGLVAGVVHVLSGPDHLAAIAPYAVADRARSWRTGVRWGLGHSAGVLGVGLLVLVARHALPLEALSAHGELGVGLALLAIGAWGIRATLHAHQAGARAMDTRPSRSGLSTDSRAALTCWESSQRSPCRRTPSRPPTCSASARAASRPWEPSPRSSAWIARRPIAGGAGAQRALLGLSSVIAVAVGSFWLLSNLRVTPSLWPLR